VKPGYPAPLLLTLVGARADAGQARRPADPARFQELVDQLFPQGPPGTSVGVDDTVGRAGVGSKPEPAEGEPDPAAVILPQAVTEPVPVDVAPFRLGGAPEAGAGPTEGSAPTPPGMGGEGMPSPVPPSVAASLEGLLQPHAALPVGPPDVADELVAPTAKPLASATASSAQDAAPVPVGSDRAAATTPGHAPRSGPPSSVAPPAPRLEPGVAAKPRADQAPAPSSARGMPPVEGAPRPVIQEASMARPSVPVDVSAGAIPSPADPADLAGPADPADITHAADIADTVEPAGVRRGDVAKPVPRVEASPVRGARAEAPPVRGARVEAPPMEEPPTQGPPAEEAESAPVREFSVFAAVRPQGSYGRARSAYRRTADSAPPLSVPVPPPAPAAVPPDGATEAVADAVGAFAVEARAQAGETPELPTRAPTGPVRVEVDDEVAVEVGLDDGQVVVTVEASERASSSLEGLQAELSRELGADGHGLDYRERGRDERSSSRRAPAADRGPDGSADDAEGSEEAVTVARGQVVNQVA